jgi:hypothetical protein
MSDNPQTTPIFYGHISAAHINLEKREDFSDLIRALDEKRICLAMWERFDPENIEHLRGYFHGYVLPEIAIASGEGEVTPEVLARVKRGLKERFLTDPETGNVPSTESLSRKRYWQFIEWCRQYSAETLTHYIEDPDTARLRKLTDVRTPG